MRRHLAGLVASQSKKFSGDAPRWLSVALFPFTPFFGFLRFLAFAVGHISRKPDNVDY